MPTRLWLAAILFAVSIAQPTPSGPPGRRSPPPAPYDVMEKSIEDLQRAMQAGEVTSRQLVEIYQARMAAYDQRGPALNAVMALNPGALEQAAALDAERAARRTRGPLHGIPVLVKDNYETIDMPTTAGSIALSGFHPKRNAFQVQRLEAAGAVILGKTTMHELAAGIVTVGSAFGQTRNPYDLDRNPGGSSGGTGAALAANFAAAGMGSDTCGSIRIPAAHNNLVGLRGTQGLSSRTGIVPLSSTQDIGGPLARSIADLALMLDATVGEDPADPSTAVSKRHIPPSYRAALSADALNGARIGVVRTLFGSAPEDQEVTRVVQRALDEMKRAGAETIDVEIPGLEDLLRNSSMINADFKFDLAAYLEAADHPPVKSLGEVLEKGLHHSALEQTFRTRNAVERRDSEDARRARVKRVALRQAIEAVLDEHRLVALVYPVLRRKAARIGDAQAGSTCQVSAHSGLPSLAVPAGFTADALPVGIELLGAAWTERDILSLGYAIEQAVRARRPPFSTPALVGGRRPLPRGMKAQVPGLTGTVVTLAYDETTSRLQYAIATGAPSSGIAVWIHNGTIGKPGAARHRLFGPGLELSGSVTLSAADRLALAEGRLLLRVFRAAGAGPVDLPVSLAR